MKIRRTEEELARIVIGWLQRDGWTVHEEVWTGDTGPRPDIVAIRGRLVQIVEVKTVLSLRLLDQIVSHRSVIRSAASSSLLGRAARLLLRREGIGYYRIDTFAGSSRVVVDLPPSIRREYDAEGRRVASRCCAENAAGAGAAAGTNGGHWTPFQHTLAAVRRILRAHGGRVALRTLMEGLQHGRGHYASTQSCRASLLETLGGRLAPWARIERTGKLVEVVEAEAGVVEEVDR